MPAFDLKLAQQISEAGIIAVLVVEDVENAVPLARALLAGGVTTMELTLRTPTALDSLRAIRAEVPEMVAGVGTILTKKQLKQAKKAGAAFGVAPGFNARVLEAAADEDFSFAPGILTPTDIEAALEYDCQLLKLFPAEISGGLAYLKNISTPYLHLGLKFIPLGGLNVSNMATYIADPLVAALGGSWLAPKELIKAKEWSKVTALASEATRIIGETRKA